MTLPHEIRGLADVMEQRGWDVDADDDALIAVRGDEGMNVFDLDEWQVVYRDETWQSVSSRHATAAAANDFARRLLLRDSMDDYDELPEPLRGFAHGLDKEWTITCGTEYGAVYLRVEEQDLEMAKTDEGRYAVHNDAEGRTLLTTYDFALAADVFHSNLDAGGES